MTQTLPVYCTVEGRSDGETARIVCAEVTAALQAQRPEMGFVPGGKAGDLPALEIRILLATDHDVSLILSLTHASGAKTETDPLAISAMDRKLSPQLRAGLYRHAISLIPAEV